MQPGNCDVKITKYDYGELTGKVRPVSRLVSTGTVNGRASTANKVQVEWSYREVNRDMHPCQLIGLLHFRNVVFLIS